MSKKKETIVSTATNGRYRGELYKDAAGKWRWRVIKGCRIIGASSEGYSRKAGALSNYITLGSALSIDLPLPTYWRKPA